MSCDSQQILGLRSAALDARGLVMLRYPIVLERDDNDTLLVSFPDFPEAHTFADDEADALARAKDALVTALEARIRDHESIPRPSAIGRGMFSVAVPALVESKLGLGKITKSHVIRAPIDRARPIETGEELMEWVEASEGKGLGLC